jgi:hypothetical protein
MIDRDSLNGRNFFSLGIPDGKLAGPLGLSIYMDRARAAHADPAAEFGSG